MDIISQTVSDIKSLKIQGASNILKASLSVLRKLSLENPKLSFTDLEGYINLLKTARPTEPLTQNCLQLLLNTVAVKQSKIISALEDIERLVKEIEEKITINGSMVLKNKNIILTHCHSTTVENILFDIGKNNPHLRIFATETRPKMQGEITAKHLAEKGIHVTLITDSQAAFVISKEDKQEIDAVLLGADVLLSDAIINKVGSYGIGLSSWRENIPIYSAATLLKFLPDEPVIEERAPSEIWENPPTGVEILNPAFDKIPAKFITGLITEAGILQPQDLKTKVHEFYPWIK